MNIFVYSDESGVFDVVHNDLYVYGGLVFLSKESRDIETRKYISVEEIIRAKECKNANEEIKASEITNISKGKIFRSLNSCEKFGIIINQKQLRQEIFSNKKHKQRYLDFVYKLAIKRKFEQLIKQGKIKPLEVEYIYFYIDEHTTATDGRYELRESMLQEFKEGMFSTDYVSYKPPIFPNLKDVVVNFCNSSKITLVRAADIVANKIYYYAKSGIDILKIKSKHLNIAKHP